MAEVLIPRGVPEATATEDLDLKFVFDPVRRKLQVVGHNDTDDTIRVVLGVGDDAEVFELQAGASLRSTRLHLPPGERTRHLWVPGLSAITTERTYGNPVRNSPVIDSVAVTEFFGGATTTHNVPMPATVAAGDALIVGFFHDNASLVQASGFSERATASLTDRCYIFARNAVGDEDSTNVNFQALTASFAVAHTYRIQTGTWAGVLHGIQAAGATGTSATPDPPNLVPTWGSDDNMWLVFCGKVQASVTGAPTNYTNFNGDSSDLSGSARRSLTASSENPGAFGGSSSFAWMAFTIAIASDDADMGDIPVFVGAGNTAAGTAGVTAALPGGIATGDKLLLHIQGEGEDANADPANADWTLVDTQASATGGTAGDTRLTVYEVDYDSSDPPSLSIGDAGDHTICAITAWRNPNGGTLEIHQFQGTTDATADTSLSATGVTTTVDNCLIVVSVGLGDDSGVLTWTNASLANPTITPAASDRTTSGADGSFSVAYGGLAGQGGSGTTTGTLATSEEEANIVIALAPVSGLDTFTRTHTTDAVVQLTGTKTHTTGALVRQTLTKTHTADSVLLSTLQKLHTTDAILLRTTTRAHTTDALIQATTEADHTTDAYLVDRLTATHTTDALIQATGSETHTTDALIQATGSETHTTDALVEKRTTRTHNTGALLQSTNVRSHTTDVVVLREASESHTSDAFLVDRITSTHTTDAVVRTETTKAHTTDAFLVTVSGETHTTDAVLQAKITRSHTTDVLVVDRLTGTHTTDAIVLKSQVRTHTTDALIGASTTRSHLTDALLQATRSSTHTTDSVIQATVEAEHTTDALLTQPLTVSHTTDAFLELAGTTVHTTDALILAHQENVHTNDALIVIRETVVHTTDALVRLRTTLGHSTDAFIEQAQAAVHTTDALIAATLTTTHTTDAVLTPFVAETTVEHTTDAVLRAELTQTHTTDAILLLGVPVVLYVETDVTLPDLESAQGVALSESVVHTMTVSSEEL